MASDKTPDDKGSDSGEPTTSVSSTDASTTQGRAAANAGTVIEHQDQTPVTRVQIEQAPDEPDVLYDGRNTPKRAPVKADYKPFEW